MDIYFEPAYGEVNEFIEPGVAETFEYVSKDGCITHMFMKRPIDVSIDGVEYFDLATPYGYGGPIIREVLGDQSQLVAGFKEAFQKYCIDNNIVSEFVRFSPNENNADEFEDFYEVIPLRHTIATYFREGENAVDTEFHKSARKVIRRALKQGVEYNIIEHPDNLDTFMDIYYDTMDRNDAQDNYYFSREYFQGLIDNFKDNLMSVEVMYEGKCIACGLYFLYEDKMHAHLSGTRHEYLNLSPAYILKYATALYGQEHGYSFIHYGGGTSNDPENPLYKFKSKFTKSDPLWFKIGKKIYNQEIYDMLVEKTGTEQLSFFPQYRG